MREICSKLTKKIVDFEQVNAACVQTEIYWTVTLLPHGQLTATVEGATPLTMLITAFGYWFQLEGHREPRKEVGSQILDEHLVNFELGSFQFSM